MDTPTRVCSNCKRELPATTEYFPKSSKKKYGIAYKCIDCTREYQRQFYHEHYADDPEHRQRSRERSRNWRAIPKNAERDRENHRDPEYRQRQRDRHEFRMANDPEYAKRVKEKNHQYNHDWWIKLVSDPVRYSIYKGMHNDWRTANYSRVLEGQRQRYNNNPHVRIKVLSRQQERYRNEPDVRYQKYLAGIKRRARKAGLPDTLTDEQWLRCLEYFGYKCAVCGKSPDMWCKLSADHWIAIADARPDNPGTVAGNIVPMCHCLRDAPHGTPSCNRSKSKKAPMAWLLQQFSPRVAKAICDRVEDYFRWVCEQDNSGTE